MPSPDQTLQEVYQTIVATLPVSDRLRLAALILNELAQQPASSLQRKFGDNARGVRC